MTTSTEVMHAEDVIADAVARIAALDPDVWTDIGPHLTCMEADALAALLTAAGRPRYAAYLIDAHATDDDEGDAHWPADLLPCPHCGTTADDAGYCVDPGCRWTGKAVITAPPAAAIEGLENPHETSERTAR